MNAPQDAHKPGPPAQGLIVRSEGWLLLTGGLRLAAAMVMATVALVPGLVGPTPVRVLLDVAAAVALVIALRTFLGGVYVEPEGLLVRNPFRSWQVRWDEIEDVAPGRGNPLAWLTLRGGGRVALCGWGWPSAARRERMALQLLNARPAVQAR